MNFVKKLFIICVGIIIALLLCEFILRVCNYKPPQQQINVDQNYNFHSFIKWAYIDIHKPFFKIFEDSFFIQKRDPYIPLKDTNIYKIKKSKKRIFIVGESVAKYYDVEILKKYLQQLCDCEIINAGMGGYDSYRIEKITKEIQQFNPDWIVMCIGNNDGSDDVFLFDHFNPIDINILAFKYKIFREIYILNVISNFLYPSIVLNKNTVENYFQKNILKIIKNLKNTKIIFCDLPNNKFFRTANVFNSIIDRETQNIIYWKDTYNFHAVNNRMAFLNKLSKRYDNVYITNLIDTLNLYCDNRVGFSVFTDNCHFNCEAYSLLSQLITRIIANKDFAKDIDICFSKEEFNVLLNSRIDIPKCANDLTGYFVAFDRLKAIKDLKNLDLEMKNIYNEFKQNTTDKIKYMTIVCYADVLQDNKEINKAKKLLNELIKLSPNNFESYLILGYIEYKNNNFKEADKYFSRVKELNQDSDINVAYLKSLKKEN